jgi:hypothetical protein
MTAVHKKNQNLKKNANNKTNSHGHALEKCPFVYL